MSSEAEEQTLKTVNSTKPFLPGVPLHGNRFDAHAYETDEFVIGFLPNVRKERSSKAVSRPVWEEGSAGGSEEGCPDGAVDQPTSNGEVGLNDFPQRAFEDDPYEDDSDNGLFHDCVRWARNKTLPAKYLWSGGSPDIEIDLTVEWTDEGYESGYENDDDEEGNRDVDSGITEYRCSADAGLLTPGAIYDAVHQWMLENDINVSIVMSEEIWDYRLRPILVKGTPLEAKDEQGMRKFVLKDLLGYEFKEVLGYTDEFIESAMWNLTSNCFKERLDGSEAAEETGLGKKYDGNDGLRDLELAYRTVSPRSATIAFLYARALQLLGQPYAAMEVLPNALELAKEGMARASTLRGLDFHRTNMRREKTRGEHETLYQKRLRLVRWEWFSILAYILGHLAKRPIRLFQNPLSMSAFRLLRQYHLLSAHRVIAKNESVLDGGKNTKITYASYDWAMNRLQDAKESYPPRDYWQFWRGVLGPNTKWDGVSPVTVWWNQWGNVHSIQYSVAKVDNENKANQNTTEGDESKMMESEVVAEPEVSESIKYNRLAWNAYTSGAANMDEALEWVNKAISLSKEPPNDIDFIFHTKACCLKALGRYEEGLDVLNGIIDRWDEDDLGSVGGKVYRYLADREEIWELFERRLEGARDVVMAM
ncbi:hypothetical protein HDV00_010941 [Rhizophlyctis rosea]|nr:hypothetical protein HDV00_010941 [Rhizophlyctis rosea]